MESLPGYDVWKTTPPEDPPCDCGREDCEECADRLDREDAYDRYVDQKIDEWKESR